MVKSFSYLLTNYFSEYLPLIRGMSNNTINSYKYTFIQLIQYMNDTKNITTKTLSIEHFNKERIEQFLLFLETTKNISITTRNQKLSAIHSFFSYVSKKELSYFNLCQDILSIKYKKKSETIITYLTIDEVKILFSIPNINERNELRNLTLLTTMYETGARVQEIIDMKVKDININSCSTIQLHGKGNKTRIIPIGNEVCNIIRKYIKINNLQLEDNLFFNKQKNKLTRVGVQYIIDKYINKAKEKAPNMFKKKIHNHSFRHSKAMHLLEAGVNLIYIRDFLGHTSITTTEIYAKANPEVKRKAIEINATSFDINSKYDKTTKDDLLNWLKQTL